MDKKAVAIIPARGGSKRIPRKNIKEFHSKPLISYSITTALESKLFDKVIVSTDDEQIATIAKQYGACVHQRPKELADDFTATQAVIDDVLNSLRNNDESYNYYCTIYATAPFLQKKYLQEGLDKLLNSDAINAFSVTSMPFPIQRTFKINKNERCEMFWPENFSKRSQDLEEAYQDAGQFYWSKLGKNSKEIMFGKDSIPIILPRYLVQDIDTLEDWIRAEYMYEALQQSNVIK
jgi:pseudaminic acid cytidylyltransferase